MPADFFDSFDRILHLDIETRCSESISVLGDRYTEHPNLEIITVAWAFDDGPVFFHDLLTVPKIPDVLLEGLKDSRTLKVAWNARFEMTAIEHVWKTPCRPEHWHCAAAQARMLSCPSSLKDAAAFIGLPEEHQKLAGDKLINLFCVPDKHGAFTLPSDCPNEWSDFREYNIRDVITERAVFKRTRTLIRHVLTPVERDLWCLDFEINQRGFPVDLDLVNRCREIRDSLLNRRIRKLSKLTGISNPRSGQQTLQWLANQGVCPPNLRQATVADLLTQDDLPPVVRRYLLERTSVTKSALKKFDAIAERTSADSRLRGTLIYYGASRTGRWTGGNRVQPQNMLSVRLKGGIETKQTYLESTARQLYATTDDRQLEVLWGNETDDRLGAMLRGSFAVADWSKELVVADLTGIEVVVSAWLAGCESILSLYRNGLDAYRQFATTVFNVPYDQVTKAQRTFAKPPVLACCYGLGPDGLVKYARGFGVSLADLWTTDHDRYWSLDNEKPAPESVREQIIARNLVDTYRETYPEIKQLWYQIDRAAEIAMNGGIGTAGRVKFFRDGPFLFCRLPSNRCLAYYRPEYIEPDPDALVQRPSLSYLSGPTSEVRQIHRRRTFGARLLENITQATARDVLVHGLLNADLMGLKVVGHVHDEIIVEADKSDTSALDSLIRAMSAVPPWGKGLPLSATGWRGKRYIKD